jgi:hypothetical protein
MDSSSLSFTKVVRMRLRSIDFLGRFAGSRSTTASRSFREQYLHFRGDFSVELRSGDGSDKFSSQPEHTGHVSSARGRGDRSGPQTRRKCTGDWL